GRHIESVGTMNRGSSQPVRSTTSIPAPAPVRLSRHRPLPPASTDVLRAAAAVGLNASSTRADAPPPTVGSPAVVEYSQCTSTPAVFSRSPPVEAAPPTGGSTPVNNNLHTTTCSSTSPAAAMARRAAVTRRRADRKLGSSADGTKQAPASVPPMPSGGLDPASAAAVFTNTTSSGNMDYNASSYCASRNNNLSSTVSSPSSANAKDTSMLKHFKVCTLNIHSLLNASHSAAVADLATSHDLDLIALTETWIKPNSTVAHLADSTPPGYSLYSKHRPLPKKFNLYTILAGGVAFLVKDSHTIMSVTPADHTSFEAFSIVIKLPSGNLTVYCVYRPPQSSKYSVEFSTFLSEFQSFLTVAANTPNSFIITGDFNIHVNKESDPTRTKFTDLLDSFNLSQLVSAATHVDKNTLDLVITLSDSSICHNVSVLPVAPSDHFPVLSILDLPTITPRPPVNRASRRIRSINIESFIHDLMAEPLISE